VVQGQDQAVQFKQHLVGSVPVCRCPACTASAMAHATARVPGLHHRSQRVTHRAGPVVELHRAADVDAARVELDRHARTQRSNSARSAAGRAAPSSRGRRPLPRSGRGTRGSPRSAVLRASRSGRRRPTCSSASRRPAHRWTGLPAPCAKPGPAPRPGWWRGSAGPCAEALCGLGRERFAAGSSGGFTVCRGRQKTNGRSILQVSPRPPGARTPDFL
jgi:hypothetical protein